jgi:hypothetical protein
MSGINGVGGGYRESRVQEASETAATATVAAPQAASGDSDPLAAIQGLAKQLEASANTRAIPAHQNW